MNQPLLLNVALSSGGMITIPPGYMQAMKAHCQKRGMLSIVDEAQTALGRCGDLFAIQHEAVVPDILTLSKTLGNGIPLSAVVTSDEIGEVAEEKGFLFYPTHGNDPLPAAVGLKVLDIVLGDELPARSKRLGQKLHAGLRLLQSRYGCIGDVRGRGLMAGLEIVSDRATKAAAIDLGKRLSARTMELGLSAFNSARTAFSGCIRIAPLLVMTNEVLEKVLSLMEEAFKTTEGSMPLL